MTKKSERPGEGVLKPNPSRRWNLIAAPRNPKRAPDAYSGGPRAFWVDALRATWSAANKKSPALLDALPAAAADVVAGLRVAPPRAPDTAPAPLVEVQSRQALVDAGHPIDDWCCADPELPTDLCILVRDPGTPRWIGMRTTRDRLGHACSVFQSLASLLPKSQDTLALTEHRHFTPPLMQLLLRRLYYQPVIIPPEHAVELACLLDYLGPTSPGPWDSVHRECAAAFATLPVTRDTLVASMHRLILGGPQVASWCEPYVRLMSHDAESRAAANTLSPAAVNLALQHASMWAPDEALAWLEAYVTRHMAQSEAPSGFVRAHGFQKSPLWQRVDSESLWRCDAAGYFDTAELGDLVRQRRRAAHAGESMAAACTTSCDWARKHLEARVEISRLRLDACCATEFTWGTGRWSFVTTPQGIFLRRDSADPFRGTTTFILEHPENPVHDVRLEAGDHTWPKDHLWGFAWADLLGASDAEENLSLANSPWRNVNNVIAMSVHMDYGYL